jgi:hypothetical protein
MHAWESRARQFLLEPRFNRVSRTPTDRFRDWLDVQGLLKRPLT